MVKRVYCSSRRQEFDSQQPHNVAHKCLTTGSLMSSIFLHEYLNTCMNRNTHTTHTGTHTHTSSHIKSLKKHRCRVFHMLWLVTWIKYFSSVSFLDSNYITCLFIFILWIWYSIFGIYFIYLNMFKFKFYLSEVQIWWRYPI